VVAIDHTRGNAVALRWLLYDGHGNLVRLMAPDYRLSAFQWRGVRGEVQGSLGTGRGYCANLGHPEDETGLVYMRARYYEPATGRFISEDPARDGVNWYLYADGNPVGKVDPSGEFGLIIGQIAGERVRADLEASGAVAAQAAKDAALRGLLDAWTRWVLKTIVYGAEALGTGEYTIASGIGTWIIRYVIGRDPSGSAFAIQVWLQNNGTRFMGIFASKSGQFYNIDIKFADSRFIWWVQQLLGGF
jgi:RHS repeat-associated protein